MRQSLVFNVAGTPRPKARGRSVRGRVVSTTLKTEKLWRSAVDRAVRAAIKASGRKPPLYTGPVKVSMVFRFQPPARDAARVGQLHTHKPDKENLEKLVLDVMERVGVFRNDSQVARGPVEKWWAFRAGLSVLVEDASEDRAAPIAAVESEAPAWLSGSADRD